MPHKNCTQSAGLIDACDLWLETQARNGKLFGTALQLQEQSSRFELTREYWDSFANSHNLRRLSACCEAYIESSPQVRTSFYIPTLIGKGTPLSLTFIPPVRFAQIRAWACMRIDRILLPSVSLDDQSQLWSGLGWWQHPIFPVPSWSSNVTHLAFHFLWVSFVSKSCSVNLSQSCCELSFVPKWTKF